MGNLRKNSLKKYPSAHRKNRRLAQLKAVKKTQLSENIPTVSSDISSVGSDMLEKRAAKLLEQKAANAALGATQILSNNTVGEILTPSDTTVPTTEQVPEDNFVPFISGNIKREVDDTPPIDEDLPFNPNPKIVSELNLRNWIIYADMVKESPKLYKTRPVDQRQYFQAQVFPVLLPTGKYAGLRLHKTWPLHFDNEYDCAMYDSDTASRILLLKKSVVTGEVTPQSDPESFLEDFDTTEAEIRSDTQMKLINKKYKRVVRLRSESTLVELEANIKNSLSLSEADPKKAMEFMDEMLAINMDEIMLKKHSHVVEMIRRLRKYIGNVDDWNLPPEELEVFNADVQKLRTKADTIYEKFKTVIPLPPTITNFWEGFNEVIRKFTEDCIYLNNREVFVLCAEPYSRQAIIDRLEQDEGFQEADIHTGRESC